MNRSRTTDDWNLRIHSKRPIYDLRLRELWDYRDLLVLLVRRDFVSFYKQTILGPIWFFLQPMLTTGMYVLVFGRLAGLSTDGLPQPIFYMTGIIAWNYFSECITKTSTVFRDNANIFAKVYFPRMIMPLSIIVSNLARFGVQLLLLVCLIVYYVLAEGYRPQTVAYIALFPVMVLIMAALGLGAGMIISAMTTRYRDLSFLVNFGVQLLMYATPVIYPLSFAPDSAKVILLANPLTPVLEGIRLALLGKGELSQISLVYTGVVTLLILLIGILTFNKVEKNSIDSL